MVLHDSATRRAAVIGLSLALTILAAACSPTPAPVATQPAATATPLPATATASPTAPPSSTITATPPRSSTAPPTPTAGPTATPVLSAESFAGIWKCCTGFEVHAVDGSFTFQHTLFRLLTTGLFGKMSIEGDTLTVVETSEDCTADQVGHYQITVIDPDTYHLKMLADPCTWRARTGSAPMDGATLHRTQPLLAAGTYTTTLTQGDGEQAGGGALLTLAGDWQLQLDGPAGYGKFALLHDGQPADAGRYVSVDQDFALNAPKLCTGGDTLGSFKVKLESEQVSFSKTQADCDALSFVLKTQPWTKQR